MSKKKRYYVGITGIDNSKGYIDLTEKEAEIVRKVVSPANWYWKQLNPWSRHFFIEEVEEGE